MGIFKKFKTVNNTQKMRKMLNRYGPYLGAGVKLEYIADDWQEVKVAMHMKWYNRNAVGTHFGGSLYSMVDPHYMLMLMKLLGNDYVVWDKAAHINFIKPGEGTVRATMKITNDELQSITNMTQNGEKYLPEFVVEVVNEQDEVVARISKTLYVRKRK